VGVPLVFVEGNADLTRPKLIGHHNPARVLREDYSAANFVDGPLLEAMRRADSCTSRSSTAPRRTR